jgi:Tfp pilus assembly protein PilV
VNEKGQTLIEAIIAIALFAMVIVGFIQGLNVGILGTYRTSQSNMALNLARSQVEYIKLQDYQPCTDAGCNVTYAKLNASVIEDTYRGLSIDSIEITVGNVSGVDPGALQQVTVTVTYENGRYANVVGYKGPRVGFSVGGPGGGEWTVVSSIVMPPPQWLYGKEGYYYVFETLAGGPLCATWVFTDEGEGHGNLMTVYVMSGTPFGDGEGVVVLESAQPFCNAADLCVKEQAAYQPDTETYLVALDYDGVLPAGTYTALFYNAAAQSKRVKTSTGSVTYWW